MKSNVLLLDKIMSYIVKRKGKQMRPMFVFLSAGTCGNISESTYRGASLIELLHTATLVHDDVVDDANYRRGYFSVNALWKNKIAVLVGDYLLSRGLLLSIDNGDHNLLKIVSTAVREICDTESDRLDSELSMNRYIIWAIPSIGFIGTVRGIGEALGQAHKAVEGDIVGVTVSLGVAFNSTFIALIISIFIMFLMHQLQLMQERLVLDSQNYCDINLIRHLQVR